ncbi:HAD family hydrolase [Roseobacter sp. HKCCA0434]|uniref:HAD family hydrolase n=1 Tax=Roseobacter sp. HKCCA0434 TaxID=3079297 RepID=UPI002905C9D0|nr:HAD family hydrolase [Roseobacter sp. HKCCA0434]
MHILHIALGGCLTWPEPRYGLTEDTGGHIAYVMGAALAQARQPGVTRVDIVTRFFDEPTLGADHALTVQPLTSNVNILRLRTLATGYLSKEALAAELPALAEAFGRLLAAGPVPDLIHTHFADAFAVAKEAARARGVPLFYTPHSLARDKATANAGPGLADRITRERTALAEADVVIVSSRDEAELQVGPYGIPQDGRVHAIAPGATLRAIASGTSAAEAALASLLTDPALPPVLAIARPVGRKNLSGLARAWAADARLREETNLVILAGQRGTGSGVTPEQRAEWDRLEAIAAAHPGRVALPLRHDGTLVAQLYGLARLRQGVFVNPALHEPFGLTVLEAAQSGVPVVATSQGGPADIVREIGHGVCVDPTDEARMASAIVELIGDRDVWDRASSAGPRGVRAYSWDRWAREVLRLARRPGVETAARPAPSLLACDIDGTLTGSSRAAQRFADWARARPVPFVVATGRDLQAARDVMADWDLPEPDVWITAVGTEIHRRDRDGVLSLCPYFAADLDVDWDRDALLDLIRRSGIALQPRAEQRRWKLACFGTPDEAEALTLQIRRAGLKARVVPSHGKFIDVLAPHGGKAAAIASVARSYGLSPETCIAAGDSGNDRDMLTGLGHGIVVGNALSDLDDLSAGASVIRVRACHADGVLEGLTHLGLASAAAEVAP